VISIVILGGAALSRGALAAVLAQEGDLEVVPEPPEPAGGAVPRLAVVVIDLDRYGVDGPATIDRLAGELPEARLLVLTGRRAPELLRRALAAQVWGLVSADTSPERLARLIRQVAAGERVIDPDLAAAALRASENPLTEKEQAALRLAAVGMRSREIAERLHLSPGTVRNYLSRAIHKTGARTRLEAIRRAQAAGWL